MHVRTLRELIEQAIVWETSLQRMYADLSTSFPSNAVVGEFWREMAIGESTHSALLRRILDSTSAERLSKPLDAEQTRALEATKRTLSRALATDLRTLNDAFEVAHELESSEINAVFHLLLETPIDSPIKRALVTAQFDEHIEKLDRFGLAYDRASRQSVLLEEAGGHRQEQAPPLA